MTEANEDKSNKGWLHQVLKNAAKTNKPESVDPHELHPTFQSLTARPVDEESPMSEDNAGHVDEVASTLQQQIEGTTPQQTVADVGFTAVADALIHNPPTSAEISAQAQHDPEYIAFAVSPQQEQAQQSPEDSQQKDTAVTMHTPAVQDLQQRLDQGIDDHLAALKNPIAAIDSFIAQAEVAKTSLLEAKRLRVATASSQRDTIATQRRTEIERLGGVEAEIQAEIDEFENTIRDLKARKSETAAESKRKGEQFDELLAKANKSEADDLQAFDRLVESKDAEINSLRGKDVQGNSRRVAKPKPATEPVVAAN